MQTGGWHLEEMDHAIDGGVGLSKGKQLDESGKSEWDSNQLERLLPTIPMLRKM
jgi:hypothetical protein